MLRDDGILTICELTSGKKPEDRKLKKISQHWYRERTVGVTRYYAALKANCKIDILAEIDEDRTVRADEYCIAQEEQYRIVQVQHTKDEDGLKITLLSLERVGQNYELESN